MGSIWQHSLRCIIEPITTESQYSEAQWIRKQVFERELSMKPPARERTPSFCRLLGYVAPELVVSDMGPSWVMLKDEVLQYERNSERKCFINPKANPVRFSEYRYCDGPQDPAAQALVSVSPHRHSTNQHSEAD
jgi:hypothetical protein